MSIKSEYRSYLKGAQDRSKRTREQIRAICNDNRYTVEGKKEAVALAQGEQKRYLAALKDQVRKLAKEKQAELIQQEKAALNNKMLDPGYQTALKSTLDTLPGWLCTCNTNDIRERLQMFGDDPFAIAAISGKIAETAGKDQLRFMGCVPQDTRGMKGERLEKLTKSVCDLMDRMQIDVEGRAYIAADNNKDSAIYISGIPLIFSTMDYMQACNEDCTEYSAEVHRQLERGEEESAVGIFDFGFAHRNRKEQ